MRSFSTHPVPEDQHIILDGDSLHFDDKPLTSIATGSLQNKIFPPHKEISTSLREAVTSWAKKNSLPPVPCQTLADLWDLSWQRHVTSLQDHITHKDIVRFQQLFNNAVFHNEDKRATSLRIYCPCIYYECLSNTFGDSQVFRTVDANPSEVINHTITEITKKFGKTYPWALGSGRDLPNAKRKKQIKQFRSGRPLVSFFSAPFRPMLNCIAKLIYQLLPKAFPHNLAKGDVFDLIQYLMTSDFDASPTPQIYNQDLAGFFTSIDTDRFIDSWHLTLQYLSATMSTNPDEILSVKPTVGNTVGDVVKGRTYRTLNVTRKITFVMLKPSHPHVPQDDPVFHWHFGL